MIKEDLKNIDTVRKEEKLHIGEEFEKLVKSMGLEELLLKQKITISSMVVETFFWKIFEVKITLPIKTKNNNIEIVEISYENVFDFPFVKSPQKHINTYKHGFLKKNEIEQTKIFKILYDNIENMVYALIMDTPAFAKYQNTIRRFKTAAKKNGYVF